MTVLIHTLLGMGFSPSGTAPPEPEPEPEVVVPVGAGGGGGYFPGTRFRDRAPISRGRLAEVADELRRVYEAALRPAADGLELPEGFQDALAEVVSPFAPVNAPDLPAAAQVDFEALADAGDEILREARRVLNLALAMRQAQEREQRQAQDDEEAAIVLLLL